MTFVFWLSAAWLTYVYVGYPAALWILGWVRRVRPRTEDGFLPTVSVLISARNEEKDIGWKVEETLKWNYPGDKLKVWVASDASDDRTDDIVRSIRNPRLSFVRMDKRGGKGRALNFLAERASGEVLFFTDANAHIGPDCLRRMVRHFADDRVGCITGGTLLIQDETSAIESGSSTYLGYEALINQLEDAIGSVLVCDGAIFCIRRSLFTPVLPELANDLELPLRIRGAGYWVKREPMAVAREKETRSARESFQQRRRISAQGVVAMWKLRQALQGVHRWQFVSRKFLRWLTLVPLSLILFSSLILVKEPFFGVFVCLQLIFYGMAAVGLTHAAAGRESNRFFSVPCFVLLGGLSTLVGVFDACRGRRFAVWDVPTLSRGPETAVWQKGV